MGCGGCAGGGCEALPGACWLDSCDSCSLLDSDFNSAFSRSSKEFLSTNSFICSFRTSTSSLTAYIKWLFTRSCKERADSYSTGKKSFLQPSPRTRCSCCHCSELEKQSTHPQTCMKKSASEHKPPSPFVTWARYQKLCLQRPGHFSDVEAEDENDVPALP